MAARVKQMPLSRKEVGNGLGILAKTPSCHNPSNKLPAFNSGHGRSALFWTAVIRNEVGVADAMATEARAVGANAPAFFFYVGDGISAPNV